MSYITLDHFFLIGIAVFTVKVWTPAVIAVIRWHTEPMTLKKVAVLFILGLFPLLLYGLGMELRGVMDIISWI